MSRNAFDGFDSGLAEFIRHRGKRESQGIENQGLGSEGRGQLTANIVRSVWNLELLARCFRHAAFINRLER